MGGGVSGGRVLWGLGELTYCIGCKCAVTTTLKGLPTFVSDPCVYQICKRHILDNNCIALLEIQVLILQCFLAIKDYFTIG